MRFTRRIITLFFAFVLLIGSMAISAAAQKRKGVRVIQRPVIVRPYYYNNYYGYSRYWNPWYDSFYGDPFFYDPYLSERRQKYYLERELRGNQRELRKHLEKYNADGVITAKEREELADDYRDVDKAKRKLAEFNNGE